jgi:two-component system, NtrC family, sensor histidine kinase HydH
MTNRSKGLPLRSRLLDFSPWILAIACTLLLLLLTLFAVSSYQREKELIGEALVQKSLTLVRFINSSARESIRDKLRFPGESLDWQEHLRAAMAQAAEQPGVETVLLVAADGKIIVQAGDGKGPVAVDPQGMALLAALRGQESEPFLYSIGKAGGEGNQKFQLAVRHGPPDLDGRAERGRGLPPMMMRRFAQHPGFSAIQEELERFAELRPFYLVQLDFELFNTPLQRQLLQIIVLLVVIALVGLGGALSVMTLRGLRGSQSRLVRMRAFTDLVVSSLPLGLIATDSHGEIQVCNGVAGALLALDERALLGRQAADSLEPELARMFRGDGSAAEAVHQAEVNLRAARGEVRTVQLISLVVADSSGEYSGEILLIRDLTQVRHLERELQRSERMAALGKMAAGVAHELRNPLSSIKGLATLLQSHFTAESKEAETAEILIKEVERLNRSIGELLEYARPGELFRKRTPINGLLEKTVSLITVDAQSSGVSVILDTDTEIPDVFIDPDRFKQVLLNLLLNAVQAMPGGGELRVSSAWVEGEVEITIRDSGVGIDPENLGRVFDPYYTTKNNGTGLGLALSLKIVEEHGGQLTIVSEPGEFTEVRLTLPEGCVTS